MSAYVVAGLSYSIGLVVAILVVLLAKVIKKQRNNKSQKGNDCNNDK